MMLLRVDDLQAESPPGCLYFVHKGKAAPMTKDLTFKAYIRLSTVQSSLQVGGLVHDIK